MRRLQQKPEKIMDHFLATVYPAYKAQCLDMIWDQRKIEIEQLMKPNADQANDMIARYKPMADLLRERYGFGKAPNQNAGGAAQINSGNNNGQAVNYDEGIKSITMNFDFKNKNTESAISAMNKFFIKSNQQMMNVANRILGVND